MEIKTDINNSSDSLKKKNGNKSKILYKFKISGSTPHHKKYIGQYFLVDFNSANNKIISQSKSNKKIVNLPTIVNKDKTQFMDNLSLLRSKSQNKRKDFRLNSIKINKDISRKRLSTVDIYPPLDHIEESDTLKTESKNNNLPDSFLNRINNLYYPKMSRIRYLANLFDDNEKNDLKMIDLKRIKGKQKKIVSEKKESTIRYDYMNLYNKYKDKYRNTLEEKKSYKINKGSKLKMEHLEKQLKLFHKLKVKNCQNKVKETLDDLNKLRNKNSIFFEKFKGECDFKFDDDLIY